MAKRIFSSSWPGTLAEQGLSIWTIGYLPEKKELYEREATVFCPRLQKIALIGDPARSARRAVAKSSWKRPFAAASPRDSRWLTDVPGPSSLPNRACRPPQRESAAVKNVRNLLRSSLSTRDSRGLTDVPGWRFLVKTHFTIVDTFSANFQAPLRARLAVPTRERISKHKTCESTSQQLDAIPTDSTREVLLARISAMRGTKPLNGS